MSHGPFFCRLSSLLMEDGGVDGTVIDYRQNQLSKMADFPPHLIPFWFIKTLRKEHEAHMDEWKVNTTLFEKKYRPMIKSEHLWVSTKLVHLHLPISLSLL